MTTTLSKSQLAKFTPLDALNSSSLGEIASKMTYHSIESGKYVFLQNDVIKRHFYLVSGGIDFLDENKQVIESIDSGSERAYSPLSSRNPQRASARTKLDSTIISIDRNLFDIFLTWDQTGSYPVRNEQQEGSELPLPPSDDEDNEWMVHLLQTKSFQHIPAINIQLIFTRMEKITYKAGETVIRQGDPGDYFYTIISGKCNVNRSSVNLATLAPGDHFGEEALISNETRNATVSMATDGSLMRLSKENFVSLLHQPLLNWVDFEQSVKKIIDGGQWLDVRLPAEYQAGHIPNSLNIPLIFLRMRANQLSIDKEYIVYCDTGRRSSVASYLLKEKGFTQIHTLTDGFANVPKGILKK